MCHGYGTLSVVVLQMNLHMQCPVDSNTLQKNVYEGSVEVDRCNDCGGIWLDHKELETIQVARDNDLTEELSKIPDYFDAAY